MTYKPIFNMLLILFFIIACKTYAYRDSPVQPVNTDWKIKSISAYPQKDKGDPERGYNYLIYGDYVGSGVPYELFEKRFKNRQDRILQREGINSKLPHYLTAFEGVKGVKVVSGNCFACHAGELNGEVVLGLGNSFSDFQRNFKSVIKATDVAMKLRYGKKSEEWAAYENFRRYFQISAPYIQTQQAGVNPAAMLAEACVMHRDPVDLTYREKPNFSMPQSAIAVDVPPLWNLKKKNALYYTAVGRGDFSKLLFQASVLGVADTTAARKMVTNFTDVIAWIKTLKPPKYPAAINEKLALKGERLFNKRCSKCHGVYGAKSTYPNKVVSLNVIKTDPLYASYAVQAPMVEWYNQSWFATSEPVSHFEPEAGYVAPPLDGIWASAPYLHNGSVPTLDDLLNSSQRPAYWRRSGQSNDYDYEKVGWNYTPEKNGKGKWTYDTSLAGLNNQGHYFGDRLTAEERKATIEYLKTL